MKKIIFVVLLLIFSLSLSGCDILDALVPEDNIGGNQGGNQGGSEDGGNTSDDYKKEFYEMALAAGYKGSYETWLNTIKGVDGESIIDIIKNKNNEIIIIMSTGEVINLGSVNPESGKDGISIIDVYMDSNNNVFVKTSDGYIKNVGKIDIPQTGEASPLITIEKMEVINNELIFTLTDESIINLGPITNKEESNKDVYVISMEMLDAKHLLVSYSDGTSKIVDVFGDVEEEQVQCTVKFDTGYEYQVADQIVYKRSTISEPEELVRDGYRFLGWYYEEEQWNFFGYRVTEDMTLYAKWEEITKNEIIAEIVETEELLSQIKWFPFGDLTRENGNYMPLPSSLYFEGKEYSISWTCNEEDLLDENYQLLKQYLRYHEVTLTYAIQIGDEVVTNEININVGLAELENTIYVGGNFYLQSDTGIHAGDALSHLSKFDEARGSLPDRAIKWGYNFGRGDFGGYTYYIDLTDIEGNIVRYQFYVTLGTIITLDDNYYINPLTGEFSINQDINQHLLDSFGGNWASFFVNTTNHDILIPMSPYAGGDTPFADNDGDGVNDPWAANPHNIGRENAFSYDGYRRGFAADANSNVVFGNGNGKIQAVMDQDGDGKLSGYTEGYADYYVTIPAGGYGMSFKTINNTTDLPGLFCEVGRNINVKYYEPYGLSDICPKDEDGLPEGLHSYITPTE